MSQAETIAKVLGWGHRSGKGWLVRCPVHDDRTPSLALADGEGGRLLVKCFAGCDPVAILIALRQKGMTSGPERAPARSMPPPMSGWLVKTERIWRSAVPLAGTPAEKYLLWRGCSLPETDEIRFLPSRGSRYPAMLSRITDAVTGKPISLHFTFIKPNGSGKAPIEKPKILLSGHRKAGGVIRLVVDAEVTMGLGLTEGIETGLSVMRSNWRPVWAAVDAGNIAAFPVLNGVESLTIFADHDRAGMIAAQKCAARWRCANRLVRIVPPETEGADWND